MGNRHWLLQYSYLSDKSNLSSRAVALLFYPLLAMALKFLEKSRKQIIENKTLVAHMPLIYYSTNVGGAFPSMDPFQKKVMDVQNICNLFTKAWSVLFENCFQLHFLDLQSLYLMPQVSCSNYECILPCRYSEAEGTLSQKRGNITSTPAIHIEPRKINFH